MDLSLPVIRSSPSAVKGLHTDTWMNYVPRNGPTT
ncbi:hypothetical protein [Escherichia phage pEC-M719-6WT.2]|nr:hypothetical protein [Escherichia phage pEC-M719-6WT.2]